MSNKSRRGVASPSNQRRRTGRQPAPPPPRRREALVLVGIGVPILVIAVVAALFFGSQSAPRTSARPSLPAGSGQAGQLVYADSPTLGPADAPVTLVEFLDPECEACRAWYPIVKQVLDDYGSDLRLVIRYVPGHGNSALAIVALEEARDQGRFWEMLEYLFEKQPVWGEKQEPQDDAFVQYGSDIGLDVQALTSALANPDYQIAQRDAADGEALGVRGTPTFFVNGSMVEDQSERGLRAAIEAALTAR